MPDHAERTDDEIIRDLYDGLVRFAAVVGRSADDPDDLLHDALVRTMAQRPLSSLDDPRAYLRRAIVNLASNRRRSLARRFRALVRHGAPGSSEDQYPSDVGALLDLAPQTRAVLWLADVEGRSFEDIAEILGVSAAAARQRASRGRTDLRQRLGGTADGTELGGATT